jgi:hypothetical protein
MKKQVSGKDYTLRTLLVNKLLRGHVRIIGDVEGQLERAPRLVYFNVEHVVILLPLVQLLP